ncbi:hypothetical protein DM02DRAFT_630873 [Periconia macrospinosa]|uniref:Uncharacterized protein n=1 Tax=Periconia macrospinosa TaxID=97972 RepID=A0A2V1DJ86_9PLEO|nr:hypothetical protein DM02DRAFT_630873 [Periconia macrospinosa]
MSTKNRWPSWSKGLWSPSEPEPCYRVGGLVPIDMTMPADDDNRAAAQVMPAGPGPVHTKVRFNFAEYLASQRVRCQNTGVNWGVCVDVVVHHASKRDPTSVVKSKSRGVASTSEHERRRRPNLTIITPSSGSNTITYQNTASTPHSAIPVQSASNLLSLFNAKLRSPIVSPTVHPGSYLLDKPLPSQPRSDSLPATPEPVELPGSILLENQGFPSPPPVSGWAPSLTMRSARSGNSLSPVARPGPPKRPQHKKSLSETSLQTSRSRPHPGPIASASSTDRSTDSRIPTCSESTIEDYKSSSDTVKAHVGLDALLRPSPLMVQGKTRRKSGEGTSKNPLYRPGASNTDANPTNSTPINQIDELKATITAQDQTISTLQAQFASLRGSHEAHVASLVAAHSAEISSLRNYTRALEEQQKQRTLHHASSNHLLFLLDTTDPPSVAREHSRASTSSASATSYRSFETALEQQTRATPRRPRDAPEMERFKRKLSATRRVQPASSRNLSRESSLQESSPAQESNEKAVETQLERVMQNLKATKASEEKYMGLLEDAERTCTEYKKKASKTEQLEKNIVALQNTVDHLEYRLELTNVEKVDLAEKLHNVQTKSSPFDVKLLSSIMDNRESVDTVFTDRSPITQNEVSEMRTALATFIDHVERLQDQIREKDTHITELNAKLARMTTNYHELVSEHQKLSLQSDIQGQLLHKTKQHEIHIEELRSMILKREAIIGERTKALEKTERQLECHKSLLEAEVRRHAALKLSGDGEDDTLPDPTSLTSKEDIDRWVDRLQAQLKAKRAKKDGEAITNSLEDTVRDLRKEIEFYVREIIYYKLDVRGYKHDIRKLKRLAGFSSRSSRSGGDVESPASPLAPTPHSPVRTHYPASVPDGEVQTSLPPILADPTSIHMPMEHPVTPAQSPEGEGNAPRAFGKNPLNFNLRRPMTPPNVNSFSENTDPGISPRSNKKLSPERRKPTPPSPNQEKFGDLATNFPLSTPASPKRHTVEMKQDTGSNEVSDGHQVREKTIPERPPRPQLGLFESPIGKGTTTAAGANAPRKDIMAEAMQQAPELPRPSNTSRPSTSCTTKREFHRANNSTPAPSNLAAKRPNTSSGFSAFSAGTTTLSHSTSCSTNRNVKTISPMLRIGVGGTMASTTPTDSPVSPTSYFPPTVSSSPPSRNASVGSNNSSKLERTFSFSSPTSASSSRSRNNAAATQTSSSSSTLRQAMNLPAKLDFMKGKGRPMKDSIGPPMLLASPFDIDRSSSTGEAAVEGAEGDIGKAV